MNPLRPDLVEELPQTVIGRQSRVSTNNHQHDDDDDDDDTFLTDTTLNDHQAHIRRRAPTRHSIKSLTGRKTLSKQNSTNEVSICFLFLFCPNVKLFFLHSIHFTLHTKKHVSVF
jgi:hypothetical protein